jgi:UTP--glucose-1-phosphate uridylyltransferase
MIGHFERLRADAVIAFERVPPEEVVQYGIAKPRRNAAEVFELEDLIEKPDVQEAPSNLAVAARYVFSPAIFDCLEHTPPGKGDEIQLTDAVRLLIREGGRVLGISLPEGEKRFDIGNFESYFEAFAEFALADPLYGPGLRARMRHLLDQPGEG